MSANLVHKASCEMRSATRTFQGSLSETQTGLTAKRQPKSMQVSLKGQLLVRTGLSKPKVEARGGSMPSGRG